MTEVDCSSQPQSGPPQPNKVVLVTGASGFLGQHVIKLLQEKAPAVQEIRLFDLKPYHNKLGHAENKPMKVFLGDIRMKSELHEAMSGADVVIHTAGMVSTSNFPDINKLTDVNVKGTQNVIDMCVEESVHRLIYTSTIDVVVGYQEIFNGDESLPRPKKLIYPEYGGTKADAECLVLKAHGSKLKDPKRGNLRTVSLRPNVMYGEQDPFFVVNFLKLAAKSQGKVDEVGNGTSKFQQAYVGNVAWGHLLANDALSRDPAVGGQPYFITDDTPLKNPFQSMQPFLEAKGYGFSGRKIPGFIAYWGLYMAEIAASLIKPFRKVELPGTSSSIAYITRTFYYSRKAAEEKLGYKPIYTYEESLQKSLGFYTEYDDN